MIVGIGENSDVNYETSALIPTTSECGDTPGTLAKHPEVCRSEEADDFPLSEEGRALASKIEEHIRGCVGNQRQPSAGELLSELEQKLGWQARWPFRSIVRNMREGGESDGSLRDLRGFFEGSLRRLRGYLTHTLSDDAIREALAGGGKSKNIHGSIFSTPPSRSRQRPLPASSAPSLVCRRSRNRNRNRSWFLVASHVIDSVGWSLLRNPFF